jgi:hypothetical protein
VGAFANIGSTAEDLAFQVLDITCSLSVLMCVQTDSWKQFMWMLLQMFDKGRMGISTK